MRTLKTYSSEDAHAGYGEGSGDTERYEYECMCGQGKVVEVHDNIPGHREHDVFISCDKCKEEYDLDISGGVRKWELVKK